MTTFFLFLLIGQADIPSAKYYTFLGGRGELQMKVSIWGEIGSPGMYSIPEGSDLLLLVTLAGGPTKDASVSNIRIVRSFPEPEVIYVDLGQFFRTGKRDKIPGLSPGDMIFVQKTRYRTFMEIMGVVSEIFYTAGFLYVIYTTITR